MKRETFELQRTHHIFCEKKGGYTPFLLLLTLLWLTFTHTTGQIPTNIDNPVLPGVADAGVIRYNGEYYIGGVATNGSFYLSEDLVHWQGPFHVFSMDNDWTEGRSAGDDQIHANDIRYINGTFHLYWSVNYWGVDRHAVHIGHATADNVLGPYKEPVRDTWVENRIDPKLFIDDDGTPYLYMVKFTDGNAIWARKMKDPWTFAGEPVALFASLPRTWETRDNRVAEGPWVIKYRNRYYMMYNANHTSTRWGNYALGVAEADAPLAFHDGSKYPAPVVQSNQVTLEEEFVDLLKYTGKESGVFRYTFTPPDKTWVKPPFDDTSWQTGKAGFGSTVVENSSTVRVNTLWQTQEVWLRKSFIAPPRGSNLMLRIHHAGETTVYLNGEAIYHHEGNRYITWNFDKRALSLLKEGENLLAIHSRKGRAENYVDVALFDMKNVQGDNILFSPGQPNILRGPNGFEWWLIYMANKNSDRRGQYINRIHFFNRKLFVDGITGMHTPGYHPAPARPTFGDLFHQPNESWIRRGGLWETREGQFVQTASATASAFPKAMEATHYLFEAGVKPGDKDITAGIYAWWADDHHYLRISLDARQKAWVWTLKNGDQTRTQSFPLPEDFRYDVYHHLRVMKNDAYFSVAIDERPAPGQSVIETPLRNTKGIPGLYTEGAAAFDGVVYTIGWDEFDEGIRGWTADSPAAWVATKKGLQGQGAVFKGDLLEQYEISVQLETDSLAGSAGLYPVYIDANNYVKAMIDMSSGELVVTGWHRGNALPRQRVPLAREVTQYADMRYTDFIEKRFTFDSPAIIDQLIFNKTPHGEPNTQLEDIHHRVDMYYHRDGKRYPIKDWTEVASPHPGFARISFEPVIADAVTLINRDPSDHRFYVYKLKTRERLRQSYNLRAVKYKDTLLLFVDGKEVLRIRHSFPMSKVGLVTENTTARFNGITVFHRP